VFIFLNVVLDKNSGNILQNIFFCFSQIWLRIISDCDFVALFHRQGLD